MPKISIRGEKIPASPIRKLTPFSDAAKAKGVKFGRPPLPLPDNFYKIHKAWRAKKLTLKQAAAACNMPVGTFYEKARKFENSA